VPYEPPRQKFQDFDDGPGDDFAQLLMGGKAGFEWPDFHALGASGHPSFGTGPIYRGRTHQANVLVLADQQSHDDLFTGRALTGESGQHLQVFLEAIGIRSAYLILRVLPVDTLSLTAAQVQAIANQPQVRKVYQAIVDQARAANPGLGLVLSFGPHSQALRQNLNTGNLPGVSLRAWKETGSQQNWQSQLPAIRQINYSREIANPSFTYDGRRSQIPRKDLPYGTLRWMGSSGDRARQATDQNTHAPSADYFKFFLPRWVYNLSPLPLSAAEQAAVDHAPN
jgi:hypothetical protein